MAVKTVGAQGYEAVMALNAVPAAQPANDNAQSFSDVLNKAGDKIADNVQANTKSAETVKKPQQQETQMSDNKTSEESIENTDEVQTEQSVTKEEPADSGKKDALTTDDAQQNTAPEDKKPLDKLTADQIADALLQIIEQLKQLCGVSDEEIIAGMESIDMQPAELFDANRMTQLLTVIAGEGEVMSLVTNEELYAMLKTLTATAETVSSQLLEELGLTQEEFDVMLEQFNQSENTLDEVIMPEAEMTDAVNGNAAQQEEAPVLIVEENIKTEDVKQPEPQMAQPENQAAKPETQVTQPEKQPVQQTAQPEGQTEQPEGQTEQLEGQTEQPEDQIAQPDGKTVQPDNQTAQKQPVKVPDAAQQQDAAEVTEMPAETQTKTQAPKPAHNAHEQKNNAGDFAGQQHAQNFDNKLNEVQAAAAETTARYTSESTENILRQLADLVKIVKTENLTQMELQLHPASLGTVHVSLVTKGGAVTAEFTAQNEAVRAAIESQVSQLMTNLEEQGVKVEAVEVSVASHGMERNLDENNRGEQSKKEQEEEQRVQNARRNSINFNSFADDEEMIEEMQGADDATRIAMEMMAANGNSMDLIV